MCSIYLNYRYLIYKIYSWTLNRNGDTPIGNTIFALAFTHFIQLYMLLLYIDRFFAPLRGITNIDKKAIYIVGPVLLVAFYFLIYNKKRWDGYVEEFKNEDERQRKRGNIIVISYLIGSVLLFFISLPNTLCMNVIMAFALLSIVVMPILVYRKDARKFLGRRMDEFKKESPEARKMRGKEIRTYIILSVFFTIHCCFGRITYL